MAEVFHNKYAQLLKEQGDYVLTVEDIDWYDYRGFMIPAYLPHCCPRITAELAEEVVQISGRPFARWGSRFGQVKNSQWWYVIRKGPWSLEQCSGNTRSKIRRGYKHLHARICTPDEILKQGFEVCRKAVERYEKAEFLPSEEVHEKKVLAANHVDGVLEFFGVFSGENLVGYSENYIQDNAVFWESIWYHPAFLPKYSSYALTDAMLNYYLNEKKFAYVSDGCRSIYHRTGIQAYLIKVFGFTREYAILNVEYSTKFKLLVNMAYPFRSAVWFLRDRLVNSFLDNVAAVLRQEYIRRACQKLKVL